MYYEWIYLDAVSKLEEAISIDPTNHYAMWCLGNAYTSQAFLNSDQIEAQGLFDKASEVYQKAVDEVSIILRYLLISSWYSNFVLSFML